MKSSKCFFKASINYQARISKDLDKCLLMLDLKHGYMNFRIPWHCSKILMFTVFEDLSDCIHLMSVSCTKSWYFSIVILVFCPQEWKKSQNFFFILFFPLLWKCKMSWSISALPYFDHSTLYYQVCPSYFHSKGLPLTAKFSVTRF